MINKLSCTILTPERVLFEGEIGFVVVQAHNGEMGFLFNHAPLISELGCGEVRLRDEKSIKQYFVDGGVVEVRDNNLIILAENASNKEDLNVQEIEKRIKELSEQSFKKFSSESMIVQAETQKLKIRLKVAKK
jgi:F-type H+-transporting ATPase subunit epsilon